MNLSGTPPGFNGILALNEHHDKLLEKRKQLDRLIANVEKTMMISPVLQSFSGMRF